jgi:methionine aminopeptidase
MDLREQRLQFGDIVSIDVGVIYRSYIGDTARPLRWADAD